MSIPEITDLDFGQLEQLRKACDIRMETLRKDGVAHLRTRFEQEAAKFGLSLADVANSSKISKRRGRPSKNADADTWSESESHGMSIASSNGRTTSTGEN